MANIAGGRSVARSLVLVGLVVGVVSAARGAWADDCANVGTQTEMNSCAEQTAQTADAALNATYQDMVRRLKENVATLEALVRAEKAWIAYRDSECEFASEGQIGGSEYAMSVAMCRDALTQARLKALQSYLSCKEGDMLCPLPPK